MYHRDYRLLAYFVAIVDCGSLTRAAAKLNVSMPVISQVLADLEQTVGASLLVRGRRRQLLLTESGKKIYQPAAQMVRAGELAMSSLQSNDENLAGEIRITMSTEIGTSWFPEI
jgi:DNA-binding transcriptional LysR family regulator